MFKYQRLRLTFVLALICLGMGSLCWLSAQGKFSAQEVHVSIGREVSVPVHLKDGTEVSTPLGALLVHGELLFTANWTNQEGAGRPLTKGTSTSTACSR